MKLLKKAIVVVVVYYGLVALMKKLVEKDEEFCNYGVVGDCEYLNEEVNNGKD